MRGVSNKHCLLTFFIDTVLASALIVSHMVFFFCLSLFTDKLQIAGNSVMLNLTEHEMYHALYC